MQENVNMGEGGDRRSGTIRENDELGWDFDFFFFFFLFNSKILINLFKMK